MMLRSSVLLSLLGAAVSFTAPMAGSPLASKAPMAFNKPATAFAVGPALPVFGAMERTGALDSLQMSCTTARTTKTNQQPCRKQCMLLGKRANNAMSVSFSHIRTHKIQDVNLQWKRVWWPEGNSFVRLRLSTKAIKTLKTKPLQQLADRVGLNLTKYRSR